MLYVLNDQAFLKKGEKNAAIYNSTSQKILHVKNRLADMILEGADLPERVLDFTGGNHSTETIESFVARTPLKAQIDSVFVDLTSACNLKCKGCYSYEQRKGEQKKHIADKHLAEIEKINVAKNAKLVLLGGEPFLFPRKKLESYLEIWGTKFSNITLFTNGYYFDEAWADFFKKYSIGIRFTLYSFDATKHDDYVKRIGSFDQVLRAIALAKTTGIRFKVNLILSSDEYSTGNKKLVKLGLDKKNAFIDLLRPTDSYNLRDYVGVKKDCGELVRPIRYKTFDRVIRDSQYHSCWSGKLAITVNGKVAQCPWEKDSTIGSVEDIDMSSVMSGWKKTIQDSYEFCSKCEFAFLCFDCSDLNKQIGSKKRPIDCRYNPLTGELE